MILVAPMLLEACITVDRATLRWLEGYFRLSSAFGADGLVHLPRGAVSSSFAVQYSTTHLLVIH